MRPMSSIQDLLFQLFHLRWHCSTKLLQQTHLPFRQILILHWTTLTENGQHLGRAINAIQLAQVSPEFEPVAAALLYRPDISALQTAYNSISGEGNAAILQTAFNHGHGVLNDVSAQSDYCNSRTAYARHNDVDTVISLTKSTPDGAKCIDNSQWRVWISGQNGKTEINRDRDSGAAAYAGTS